MKPLKQSICITLDGDIIDAIKVCAEACARSVSHHINLVLKKHLSEKRLFSKNRAISMNGDRSVFYRLLFAGQAHHAVHRQ